VKEEGGAPVATPQETVFESDSAREQEMLENAARFFFEAGTWHELAAICREPERVGPLIREWHQSRPVIPLRWRQLAWSQPIEEEGRRLFYARSEFEGHEPVNIIIEQSGGVYRVDWESHVRHSEMDWQDFIKSRPVEPRLFRVLGSLLPGGTDPATPDRLQIRHPDLSDSLIEAELIPGDPVHQRVRSQLEMGAWKNVPLTLRLCYDEKNRNNESGAVRITGVEGKGWLILSRK